jgi:hypothetical protein
MRITVCTLLGQRRLVGLPLIWVRLKQKPAIGCGGGGTGAKHCSALQLVIFDVVIELAYIKHHRPSAALSLYTQIRQSLTERRRIVDLQILVDLFFCIASSHFSPKSVNSSRPTKFLSIFKVRITFQMLLFNLVGKEPNL